MLIVVDPSTVINFLCPERLWEGEMLSLLLRLASTESQLASEICRKALAAGQPRWVGPSLFIAVVLKEWALADALSDRIVDVRTDYCWLTDFGVHYHDLGKPDETGNMEKIKTRILTTPKHPIIALERHIAFCAKLSPNQKNESFNSALVPPLFDETKPYCNRCLYKIARGAAALRDSSDMRLDEEVLSDLRSICRHYYVENITKLLNRLERKEWSRDCEHL